MRHQKTAWLIGLYTNDMEYRIKRLGYKLVRYFPDLHFDKRAEEPPKLIVFSEDRFSDPQAMHRLRSIYPDTIMISLSLYLPSDHPSYHKPLNPESNYSLIRLITNIQAMETRWEN